MIATCELDSRALSSAFGLRRERIHVTGYPRCDVLFDASGELDESAEPFRYLYLPTFRDRSGFDPIQWGGSAWGELNDWLGDNSAKLDIKLHPAAVVLSGNTFPGST